MVSTEISGQKEINSPLSSNSSWGNMEYGLAIKAQQVSLHSPLRGEASSSTTSWEAEKCSWPCCPCTVCMLLDYWLFESM